MCLLSKITNVEGRTVDKIYSFDVFDTCLTRAVARPSDIFYFLNRNGDGSIREPASSMPLTANIRLRAEQSAREKIIGEDLSLDEIYRALPGVDPFGSNPANMLRRELDLEKRVAPGP